MADAPRAVILAAGEGTRMRSARPKVLHLLAGRPLLLHVVDLARTVTGAVPLVVVNPAQTPVLGALDGVAEVVEQVAPLGTGDALRAVPDDWRTAGPVLVLSADVPLVRAETVRRLLAIHERNGATATVLTAIPEDPGGLGRVHRDPETGCIVRIVEERDLPPGTPPPREVSSGVYVFDGEALWPALAAIGNDNAQREYYLPDVLPLLMGPVEAFCVPDPEECLGINDRVQLAAAEAVLRRRIVEQLMRDGVTVEDPRTTYVDAGVRVGRDSVIRPLTVLRGQTVLGEACEVGPMAQLTDVIAGNGVVVGASHLEACRLGDGVVIGSYNRVRRGSVLADGVVLGTHAEVKNSHLGTGTRQSHSSCVLDSQVGSGVNIGAGTVTCNFDGEHKHQTLIEDGVFVGSNSTLVAPVTVRRHAYVAAGSLVDKEVPAESLAVGRARQRNVQGWVRRRHAARGASE